MTVLSGDEVRTVAGAIADRLASPSDVRGLGQRRGWWPQSLAQGAVGVSLLHIERARTGLASWQRVHDWLACAAHGAVSSGTDSHLFYGAPALAFAMHSAADRTGRYARALDTLDRHIIATTRRRLDGAHARMDRGGLPDLAEFDAIRGLSGIGAHLLRREPQGDLIREILAYLVRLTEPVNEGDEVLPGWWTGSDPAGRPSDVFPMGHANNGMAHGIGGPLALLSLAMRSGRFVDGQAQAITRICAWLDRWRQDSAAGPWWPYWVTRAERRAGRPSGAGPLRPSWCYGTAGLARAQQLAALALGDLERQRMAEQALVRALTDPGQLAATTGLSLCHGLAGLAHLAGRCASNAVTKELATCPPPLLDTIVPDDTDADRMAASLLQPPDGEPGLLEGAAGTALALHTAACADTSSTSGWDSCLLIN